MRIFEALATNTVSTVVAEQGSWRHGHARVQNALEMRDTQGACDTGAVFPGDVLLRGSGALHTKAIPLV